MWANERADSFAQLVDQNTHCVAVPLMLRSPALQEERSPLQPQREHLFQESIKRRQDQLPYSYCSINIVHCRPTADPLLPEKQLSPTLNALAADSPPTLQTIRPPALMSVFVIRVSFRKSLKGIKKSLCGKVHVHARKKHELSCIHVHNTWEGGRGGNANITLLTTYHLAIFLSYNQGFILTLGV